MKEPRFSFWALILSFYGWGLVENQTKDLQKKGGIDMAGILVKLVSDLTPDYVREAVATGYGKDVKRLLDDLDKLAVRWGREVSFGSLAFKEGAKAAAEIQAKLAELRAALKRG